MPCALVCRVTRDMCLGIMVYVTDMLHYHRLFKNLDGAIAMIPKVVKKEDGLQQWRLWSIDKSKVAPRLG